MLVLEPFCSISQGSTLRLKGWTDPIIHSKVLFLYLCGEGAGGALAPSR